MICARLALLLTAALSGSADDIDGFDHLSLLQTRAAVTKFETKETEEVPDRSLARMARQAHHVERRKEHGKGTTEAHNEGGGAVRLIDFTYATIIYNNLGGQGPVKTLASGDASPEEIRYRGLIMGSSLDFVITAAEGYEAFNPSRNGILLSNGQINAKSGTTASLTYTFVEQGTYTPVVMPLFYITFSDLDERHGGVEKEKVSVGGYDTYYTNDDLMLLNNGNDTATFQSSDYGNYEDNSFYADSPSPTQLSHAVTYKFTNKATFNAEFAIEDHRDFDKGRNVLFSGISQLVFCQEPSTYLDFANATVTTNNLGGLGPGAGKSELRYGGIATSPDGDLLDLVFSADEAQGYNASNSSQNGLHGEFGHINLYAGPTVNASHTDLIVKIVKTGTEIQVELPQFAFVVFDFDTGLHEQQIEYVDMAPNAVGFDGGTGYSSYIVTDTTEVAVAESPQDDGKRFKATKHGTQADNPTHAQNLARETADKSVVFTFRKTSLFKLTLGITPTGENTGRNFMFSGQDMYLMCD